ncbi:SDR family oxidoreductase [Methanobrevibacter sp.]|uniref:SDR family oxidoreductase n=1 Tax=Methanobrevibacter sp. TaxID=66852 RepID=UPI00388F7717
MKTIVVVGAGKGMGNHIAEKFAQNDFRVVLMARRAEALDEYVGEFEAKGFDAYGEVADVTDMESLTKAFDNVIAKFDSIDVLVYNAAHMDAGNASKLTADEMVEHFKTDVVGAQVSATKVIPVMKEQGEGAILFTGGLFGVHPNAFYEFACMSMDKAALRQLVQMLNQELADDGIFAGIVNIMGVVGSDDVHQPSKIAEKYWELYTSRKDFEICY